MRLLSNFVVVSSLAVAATAQTITIPQQAVGVEGPSTTAYPWSPGTLATGCIRSQYFYTKNAFLNQSVNFPIVINQLSWRANGGAVGGGTTFPNVQVLLSTATPGAILAPNTTFANNHGPDVTTVYPSGPVTLLTPTGASPNSYICTLTLATPFPYDPNVGDLCIDISNQNALGIAGLASDQFTTLGADGARVWDWAPGSTFMNPASGNNQPGIAIVVQVGYAPPSGVLATNTTLGTGCIKKSASFYENFGLPSAFDLNGTSMTLIPATNGYIVTNGGAFLPVGTTSTPVPLTLGDDTEVTVPLGVMGSFPAMTGPVSSLTVCSNGYVSTASGNGVGYVPSVPQFLNGPQTIFSCWHDFNVTLGGAVKFEETAAVSVITWDNVRSYLGTGPADDSTWQLQFYASGTVVFAWQTMSATNTSATGYLVGYSPGGPNVDPGNTDISATLAASVIVTEPDVVPLALAATSRPITGTSWAFTTSSIPATGVLGVDILGLSNPNIPDLFFLGMPTCGLFASLDVMNAYVVAGASHNWSLAIPANPTLLNLHIFASSAVFQVPPVNAFGAITSNGIDGKIGDV